MKPSMCLAVLWAALLASPLAAQTIVGPETVPAGQPAWFTVADVPAGVAAHFAPRDYLESDPSHVASGTAMFWAATPGEYQVQVALVWSPTEVVWLDKRITVGGEVPTPNPPVPPVPPGEKLVVVIAETRTRTAAEASTLAGLLRWCQAEKVQIRIMDPDSEASWLKSYSAELARRKLAAPALMVSVLPPASSPLADHVFLDAEMLPASSADAIAFVQEVVHDKP